MSFWGVSINKMYYTECELLPGIWGQGKAEESHGRYKDARYDEVKSIVEGSSSYVDVEGDVDVRLWTARVHYHVARARQCWKILK